MNANRLPAAATSGQAIVSCQWLTSMPSMKPDVSGGSGTSTAVDRNSPRAAYSALTPNIDETLWVPIFVIRYQLVPRWRPLQSAAQLPPVTVPDAMTLAPADSLIFVLAEVWAPVRRRTPPQTASSGTYTTSNRLRRAVDGLLAVRASRPTCR